MRKISWRNLRRQSRKTKMTTFHRDLDFGNKYQEHYINTLTPRPTYLEVIPGNFKPFDFVADGVKYECKADRMAYKTGNICIEYESRGSPSGIETSEADFWVYMLVAPDGTVSDTYKIPTGVIKEEIAKKSYHRDIAGGDDWKNRLLLFNRNIFSAYRV